MKKLSILCGIALVLALMSGPVLAQNYYFDVTGDGVADTEATIFVGETISVDVYLTWTAGDNLAGNDYRVNYPTNASLVSATWPGDPWDEHGEFPNSIYIDLSLLETSTGVPAGDILQHTVVLECDSLGDVVMTVSDTYIIDSADNDAYTPTVTELTIHQTEPQCECDVTPGTTELGPDETQQFTGVAGTFCASTPSYAWTTDCACGSVDSAGLFTADNVTAFEECTVTATDQANTATGGDIVCEAAVTCVLPSGCATKIYKGGVCEEANPIDTVYNRPGRRGLSMTCCEYEEFCVCSSCDEEMCFAWDAVTLFSGGLSADDLMESGGTGDQFTLKIAEPCTEHCPDEATFVIVAVQAYPCTDAPIGDPGSIDRLMAADDYVRVDIGRVALGLGDTNAHPDTQTTDIDVLLWNYENHVRAVQADICSNQAGYCEEIVEGRGFPDSCTDVECGKITEDSECGNAECTGMDEANCPANPDCFWNDAYNMCLPANFDCFPNSGMGMEAACLAAGGCQWNVIGGPMGYCSPLEGTELCEWKTVGGIPQCVNVFDCEILGGACVAADNLVCTECVVDEDRSAEFACSANEQANGCCRVTLYTTEPDDLIQQGDGAIARVKFDVGESLGSKDCVELIPTEIKISDQFNEFLCAVPKSGEICFRICGDVYPQDCYECASCGDGVVDLFDILEEIDIVLGLQEASYCQMLHGDVPLGMPPFCGNPAGVTPPNCEADGEIDIFDALVIIDKALSRMNCCDYCMFGEIY